MMHNFRDLGGLPTKCERKTKPGLLFRTGNVAHWSEQSAIKATKEHGIKLYLDFRNPEEVKIFGRPEALLKNGVEWIPISIDTRDAIFEAEHRPSPKVWTGLYQRIFDKNYKAVEKFIHLVRDTHDPILYGCLFGKDRTGIATSLILDLLDVHESHIAMDYAKTTHEIGPLTEKFNFMWSGRVTTPEENFKYYSVSHEEVILAFLEYIRTHPDDSTIGPFIRELKQNSREHLKARLLK